jgi:serine/threonine protein kinase
MPFDETRAKEKMRIVQESQGKKGGAVVIKSVDDFIKKLQSSPGSVDKPVRLIAYCLTGDMSIAKFASEVSRNHSLKDEINNTLSLQLLKCGQHVANAKWYTTKNKTNTSVLCLDYIPPFQNFHTLRQLCKSGNELDFRQALFQTLFAVFELQSVFPGFRHNDLKADNVLVCESSSLRCRYIIHTSNRSYCWDLKSNICAKLIDFEVASAISETYFKSKSVMDPNQTFQINLDYGLAKIECNIFDIHLLFFDLLGSSKDNKMLHESLKAFVHTFLKKELFFPENLTSQSRLRVEDQEFLHVQCGKYIIFDMLQHEYFAHLRCLSNTTRQENIHTILL